MERGVPSGRPRTRSRRPWWFGPNSIRSWKCIRTKNTWLHVPECAVPQARTEKARDAWKKSIAPRLRAVAALEELAVMAPPARGTQPEGRVSPRPPIGCSPVHSVLLKTFLDVGRPRALLSEACPDSWARQSSPPKRRWRRAIGAAEASCAATRTCARELIGYSLHDTAENIPSTTI